MLFAFYTLEPSWWLLPIIAIAIGLAMLYYRKQTFDRKRHKVTLTILRALGLASLLMLLLEPILKFTRVKENKPLIMVYKDVSESIPLDSVLHFRLKEELERFTDFDIQWNDLAANIAAPNDSISKKETNLQAVNQHLQTLEKDNAIAAALVITDGISNAGGSPEYPNHKVPIYTLGQGNPKQVTDASVVNVLANKSVFKGNETLLETTIQIKKALGETITVQLFDGKTPLAQKTVTATDENHVERLEFTLKPKTAGMHIYSVQTSTLSNETNTSNNKKVAVLRVEDNQKKVHIISHAPHPDIGAIKAALKPEKTFLTSAANLSAPINPADIYIVHGIPETTAERNFLSRLLKSKAPFWSILTAKCRPSLWSSFSDGLSILERGALSNQASAAANTSFTNFYVKPEVFKQVEKFPPLSAPYLNVRGGAKLNTLFNQKIGSVRSNIPLWSFYEKENQRTAWLFGEGIWSWRMADFRSNGSFTNVDDLIVKTVQYLASSTVKNGFITYPSEVYLPQGQSTVISAEYRDETGNRVNEIPASVSINGQNGFKKSIQFAPFQDIYRANVGSLPPGKYNYTARLEDPKGLKAKGYFEVEATNIEKEVTEANHSSLKNWSKNTGGYFALKVDDLVKALKKNTPSNAILTKTNTSKGLIEFWPYLLFIVLCFSAEWFLRKYLGKY